jgi:RimJ/RimL family protein N-acetyltransferase
LLETERLRLRKPRLADAADPHVIRFLGPETGNVSAVVRRWLDDWETYPLGKFLAERTEDGIVVGRVGLNYFDPQTWERSTSPDALPELGWGLTPEYWGNGYATEAALAVRTWAACDRLISLIAPDNIRSARVAERLGARPGETISLPDGDHVVWKHPQ